MEGSNTAGPNTSTSTSTRGIRCSGNGIKATKMRGSPYDKGKVIQHGNGVAVDDGELAEVTHINI